MTYGSRSHTMTIAMIILVVVTIAIVALIIYLLIKALRKYLKSEPVRKEKIANAYADKKAWARMCLKNIANCGKFSSDRTIEDYVRDIWHLNKVVLK